MAEILTSLIMLSAMEIVLGIDNILFIGILVDRLPLKDRERIRRIGLLGAVFTRILLLTGVGWLAQLTEPLFLIGEIEFSGKALILTFGGIFLVYKAVSEIVEKFEEDDHETSSNDSSKIASKALKPAMAVFQIIVIDVIFSLDSVITAVGMVNHVLVMIAANLIALLVMFLSGPIVNGFIAKYSRVKILALSFLVLIGGFLTLDGCGIHLSKSYVYFAMVFSIGVEFVNLRLEAKKV